jgi:Tol biopolymer transport system component
MRRLLVILGVAAVAAAAVTLWAGRGGSGAGKGIVFRAKVDGTYQLFTIAPDGSHLRQLTHLAVHGGGIPGAESPDWSPDGKTIVFDSDYQDTKQDVVNLFTIRPDGTGLAEVPLEIGKFVGSPAYSPDGSQISFDWEAAAHSVHQQGIDIANADGSEVRRFTSLDQPNVLHHASAWSPDGSRILYTEMRGTEASSIIVQRLDGTGRRELTRWALNANNAAWSPDGRLIAFNSHNPPHPGESANLYMIHADGTGLTQLTHYSGGTLSAYMGDWSPDGRQIVFHLRGADADGPGVNQLFLMDSDGRHVRRLTRLPRGSDPGQASWSAAG